MIFGGGLTGTTGRGVVAESVSAAGGEGGTERGVFAVGGVAIESVTDVFGVAIVMGVVAGVSAGRSDKVSKGLGTGVVISNGSGEAVSSGLTEALGLAMALADGLGFGEGEGGGVSTGAAGLL